MHDVELERSRLSSTITETSQEVDMDIAGFNTARIDKRRWHTSINEPKLTIIAEWISCQGDGLSIFGNGRKRQKNLFNMQI